jgi:hypothetical protein
MEQKYKAHFMDMDNYGEVIKRVVLNEDQKKLLDYLLKNEILPEWFKVEYIPEENVYESLT